MNRETAETFVDALGAANGIVATVGAGGKKTTLYRLLEAHRAIRTGRIMLTSTVQTGAVPKALDVPTVLVEQDDPDLAIAETGKRDGAWLFAGHSAKPRRFSGLSLDLIPSLHVRGRFDVSLVKADGARMRMVKAPGRDEPALPKAVATILPVVSARAIGRPLGDMLVHHPERLAKVVDAEPGTELTADHVARLLSSPDGALRRVGDARVVPVINMVDSPERLALARDAARKALSMTERFERVVLASMASPLPLVEVIGG
ncbi:MAG: selenium cofactor biosynthesis protein YqeC [Geminicoccaceae bacterium]